MFDLMCMPFEVFTLCMQVAYVPQSAFIYNATVRENILFGQPYDPVRYQRAIEAAALETDLQTMTGTVSCTIASGSCPWVPCT